ncbi:MAG: CPBP family intramembrane glutamic endopeptidase [Pirellulales bacterium]
MPQPDADPFLGAFTLALIGASITAWGYLLSRLDRADRILAYEPRRPVPWGWPAASVAFILVLLTVPAAIAIGTADRAPIDISPSEATEHILGFLLFQVVVGAVAVAIPFLTSRPDRRDLGLPDGFRQLLRDVGIGAIACLASIAPVFGMLLLMQYLEGGAKPSHHPLIETVEKASSLGVLILASISAVIFAPISEEIVFRLLLQGWLEKWEAEKVGSLMGPPTEEMQMTNEEQPPTTDSSIVIRHSSLFPTQPPERGLFGLPYGWTPILISSVLFALAHFGYGPEPVPLFFLALILGYVYQRTHRIVPCIVMHALFNLVSVIALWRMIGLSPE